jgi:hypothetical protein
LRPAGILAAHIRVAGVPVEIAVAPVSPAMVRITVQVRLAASTQTKNVVFEGRAMDVRF